MGAKTSLVGRKCCSSSTNTVCVLRIADRLQAHEDHVPERSDVGGADEQHEVELAARQRQVLDARDGGELAAVAQAPCSMLTRTIAATP